MTNKWFKVIKITATVLTVGANILSAWVDSKEMTREIGKEVNKAVANIKKGS